MVYVGELPTATWGSALLTTSGIKIHLAHHKLKGWLGLIWSSQELQMRCCGSQLALSFRLVRANNRQALLLLRNVPLEYFPRENCLSRIIHIQISEPSRRGNHKEMETPEISSICHKKPKTQPHHITSPQEYCTNTLESKVKKKKVPSSSAWNPRNKTLENTRCQEICYKGNKILMCPLWIGKIWTGFQKHWKPVPGRVKPALQLQVERPGWHTGRSPLGGWHFPREQRCTAQERTEPL